MRLIDADAFIRYIDSGHLRSQHEVCFSESDVVEMIGKQPTIEAEPVKHGRWIFDNGVDNCYKCSECKGMKPPHYIGHEFCPNCGAIMDLEVNHGEIG